MNLTPLFQKSIKTLELPKVLDKLANLAVTDEGRERARGMLPFLYQDEVNHAQDETEAAIALILQRGSPSFYGVASVSASLQRADIGGVLSTTELLSIGRLLRATTTAFDYGDSDQPSAISHLFASLTPNRPLEETISTSILGENEIADSASSALANLRRQIRGTQAKVRDLLQKFISSNSAQYLQDALITQRGGRYVVPVKSEHKNSVAGMVHDVSSSGSTFFIEPMSVVNANNELRELQIAEQQEIARILAEISAECAQDKMNLDENYTLLILLDVIFAKGKLGLEMNGIRPALSSKFMDIQEGKHPLLDLKTAVPNHLTLGDTFDTLMITGPNTGGKTVTLKTMGLLTLMAQCGLHIPAHAESTVCIFSKVLADIGDDQSIAQSLSTFSAHMTNIVGILEEADDESLVLFDELGAGTDPVEGAALATSIIEYTRQTGAKVVATTHYSELKLYAMTTTGVENASCHFDVETLAPTYRLVLGIPGKSNAFAISRRLGLSETLISKAQERLDGQSVKFEDVLTSLEEKREQMEFERNKSHALNTNLAQSTAKAREYEAKLKKEVDKAKEKAREEAQALIDEARVASDLVFQELKAMKKQQQDWQKTNESRTEVRALLNQTEAKLGAKPDLAPPPVTRPAEVGDTVTLLKVGTEAEVVAIKKDGKLELQAGMMKITAKQEEVRVVEGKPKVKPQVYKAPSRQLNLKPTSTEIDLRGMECIEAICVLDQFLDSALLGKLEKVCIIHGKGTGAVRSAVRSHLKTSRYIKEFRAGLYGEGEDGVTVATLK
ncbi:MAG: endonuclease MutS2 [Eubacteriales bacterium]